MGRRAIEIRRYSQRRLNKMSVKAAVKKLEKEGFPDLEPSEINIKVFKDKDPELYNWLRNASKEEERSINAFAVRALKEVMTK
jgi:hypothetical protein